jgi:hypothetical protein
LSKRRSVDFPESLQHVHFTREAARLHRQVDFAAQLKALAQ